MIAGADPRSGAAGAPAGLKAEPMVGGAIVQFHAKEGLLRI